MLLISHQDRLAASVATRRACTHSCRPQDIYTKGYRMPAKRFSLLTSDENARLHAQKCTGTNSNVHRRHCASYLNEAAPASRHLLLRSDSPRCPVLLRAHVRRRGRTCTTWFTQVDVVVCLCGREPDSSTSAEHRPESYAVLCASFTASVRSDELSSTSSDRRTLIPHPRDGKKRSVVRRRRICVQVDQASCELKSILLGESRPS
jgi:hypothetical protein